MPIPAKRYPGDDDEVAPPPKPDEGSAVVPSPPDDDESVPQPPDDSEPVPGGSDSSPEDPVVVPVGPDDGTVPLPPAPPYIPPLPSGGGAVPDDDYQPFAGPAVWGPTRVTIIGTSGQGEEIVLTGERIRPGRPVILLQEGATGLDLPPMDVRADSSPNLDGGWFRSVRAAERHIMLPLFLYATDRKSILALKQKLARVLNPKRGYCVLRFVEGGVSSRYLKAWYTGGMEGDEGKDSAGFTWCKYGIQLTAYDPWFYGSQNLIAEWHTGSGSSTITSEGVIVFNPGDVEAWPVWELKGPVKSFTISKQDGRSFGMHPNIPGRDLVAFGQTLKIDTRPGFKTVMRSDGFNMWPFLDPNPAMFELPAGRARISVELTPGAYPATLRLSLSPRFETF